MVSPKETLLQPEHPILELALEYANQLGLNPSKHLWLELGCGSMNSDYSGNYTGNGHLFRTNKPELIRAVGMWFGQNLAIGVDADVHDDPTYHHVELYLKPHLTTIELLKAINDQLHTDIKPESFWCVSSQNLVGENPDYWVTYSGWAETLEEAIHTWALELLCLNGLLTINHRFFYKSSSTNLTPIKSYY